jgi:hypothetical protein
MRVIPFVLCLALLPAAGCGDGGGLKGSICTIFDCEFDTVTIRDVSATEGTITTVQVDYTIGPYAETVPRAAVIVCDVTNFVRGEPMPLTSARHVVPGAEGDFPEIIKEGTCTFDTDLAVDGAVSGKFHVVFTTEENTDRALFGDFEGTLLGTDI